MFWLSGPQNLVCFYCNQRFAVARQGQNKDWKCPGCDALNILDENGNIADTIPQRYQADQERQSRFGSLKTSTPSLATPFCSVCTSNQALLIKTLANYLPADDDPDIDIYERALPAYRASLEDRYPPVCSACAPQVQTRLKRNNYIAKSSALGKWLNGAKGPQRTSLRDARAMKVLQVAIWLLRLLVWFGATLLMLTWYLCGVRSPANQKFAAEMSPDIDIQPGPLSILAIWQTDQEAIRAAYTLRRRWLPVSILGAFWNSKGLYKILHPSTKFVGSSDYKKLQIFIQVMRFGTIYLMPLLGVGIDLHQRLSALFLLISVFHLLLSFTIIKEVLPMQLDLKERSGALVDAAETDGSPDASIPQSVPFPVRRDNMLPSLQIDSEGEEGEADGKDEMMDWQPSPPNTRIASPSPFITSNTQSGLPRMFPQPVFSQPREQYFSTNKGHRVARESFKNSVQQNGISHGSGHATELKRQTFFAPERPTGLENLFNAAVRLDDEPILVQSIKSVRRNPLPAAIVLTCITIVVLLTIKLSMERAIGFEIAASTLAVVVAWYSSLISPRVAVYCTALLGGITGVAYFTRTPRGLIEWAVPMLTAGHQAFLLYKLMLVHNTQRARQQQQKTKRKTIKVK